MTRESVYKAIDSERDYQATRWNENTTSSGGKHSLEEWFMYMEDYINEAKHLLSRGSVQATYFGAVDTMRKVTAMGVAAMEEHGARLREIVV